MLILLVSRRLQRFLDTKSESAPRHHNSVFYDLLKRVPWDEFERLTTDHGADHRIRRLPTKSQFIVLLYGQFSGAASLREIVGGLESHAVRLYHVGGSTVSRLTLADANAQRPSAVFSDLFAVMVARAQRGLRCAVGEATYLIDSTGIRLSGLGAAWAHFSAKACGAKAHVIYDADRPVYAAVTGTAEREAALKLVDGLSTKGRITLGADKGYDVQDFVRDLRVRKVTPHIARNEQITDGGTVRRRSAIDGRTTRHPGYAISLRIRKRIEEGFGWAKTTGGLRKTRHKGTDRVDWVFTLTAAAYNLVRLPKLIAVA